MQVNTTSLNILMKFEDKYGCYTLFSRVNDLSKINNANIDITVGLSNSLISTITKQEIENYDYILIIFDMDSTSNNSLTSKELMAQIKQLSSYKNIVLIPVLFCYESLILYDDNIKAVLQDIQTNGEKYRTRSELFVKEVLRYYNLIDEPENLYNIDKTITELKKYMEQLTGNTIDKKWYPQKIHTLVYEGIMHAIFKYNNIDVYTGTQNSTERNKKSKIFSKNEDKLFNELSKYNIFDFEAWIKSIQENTKLNEEFANILKLDDAIQNLNENTFDKKKEYISIKLDMYNKHIKGEIKLIELLTELEYTKYMLNIKKVGYKQIANSMEIRSLIQNKIASIIDNKSTK